MWENEHVDGLLRAWRRSRGEPEDGPAEEPAAAAAADPAAADAPAQGASEGQGQGAGTSEEGAPPAEQAAGEDVHMNE